MTIKPNINTDEHMKNVSLLATLLFTSSMITGCASAPEPAPPAPEAAVINDSDIENLLRIVVELREDMAELRHEIDVLKSQR